MDEITIGIKVPIGDIPAKAQMVIKQMTGLPLGDIKTLAANDDYIFECPVEDDEGLHLINQLKRELAALGVEPRLFEDDEEEDSEMFDNMEELYEEIDEYGENHPD